MDVKLSDIMARDIVSVPPSASIKDTAETLLKRGISSVVIKKGEEIVGIVTDRDFVKLALYEKNSACAEEIMSSDLITIDPETDLIGAVKLMGKHKIRHLLVKESDKIIGIVSLRDILKIVPEAIYGYIAQEP
jgi:CBS domain-containing protein